MSHAGKHRPKKQLDDAIKAFAKAPLLDDDEYCGWIENYHRILADVLGYRNAGRLRMGDYAKNSLSQMKEFLEYEQDFLPDRQEEGRKAIAVYEKVRKMFIEAAQDKPLQWKNREEQLENLSALPEALAKLIEMTGYMETGARMRHGKLTNYGKENFAEYVSSEGGEDLEFNESARRLKRRELRANGVSENDSESIVEGYNPTGDYGSALDLATADVNKCRAEKYFLGNFKEAFERIVVPVLGKERASSGRDFFG